MDELGKEICFELGLLASRGRGSGASPSMIAPLVSPLIAPLVSPLIAPLGSVFPGTPPLRRVPAVVSGRAWLLGGCFSGGLRRCVWDLVRLLVVTCRGPLT